MDDFLDCIEALRQGEIGLGELFTAFEELLARDPAQARDALTILTDLSNQGRFPPQVVTMLEGRLPKERRSRRATVEAPAPGDERTIVITPVRSAPPPAAVPIPPVAALAPVVGEDALAGAGGAPPAAGPAQSPEPDAASAGGAAPAGDAADATATPTGPGEVTAPRTDGGQATAPPTTPTDSGYPPAATQPSASGLTGPSLSLSLSGETGSDRSAFSDGYATGGNAEARVPEVGAVLRGRFELLEELGRGGMGIVYKARDRSRAEVGYTNEEENYVAIKLLNEEFKRHPGSIRVFGREFRNTQRLNHPNIVNLYDFDKDGFGNYFIAMELLAGEPLNQLTKRVRGSGLPFAEAHPLIRQMGEALAAAHGLNPPIIHSDFKPGNVFLGPNNHIKVFDFGIARAARPSAGEQSRTAAALDNATLDRDAPSSGSAGGHEGTTFVQGVGALTIAYASPEMLLGEDPEVRDDLYALAIVAYQLLSGERPFRDPRCGELNNPDCRKALLASRRQPPPRPPRLTTRQWRALSRGLAFERAGRCRDIPEFLDELRPRAATWPYALAAGTAGVLALGWFFGLAPWLHEREQAAAAALAASLVEQARQADPAALEPQPAAAADLPEALRAEVAAAVLARLVEHLVAADADVREAARERLVEFPEETRGRAWDRARARLTDELRGAGLTAMAPRLAVVEELPAVTRVALLAEIGEPIREALIGASRDAFAPEREAYDYARATALLAQAERLQPGLKVIDDERGQLKGRYERLLSDLDERIIRLREQGKLLRDGDADSVPRVLALLRQVAPEQYASYGYVASNYYDAAKAVEATDLPSARTYVEAGLALFPDSAELKNQLARLDDLARGQTRAQAIAALRKRVADGLDGLGGQPPDPQLVAGLAELRVASPDDPLLARANQLALAACDKDLPPLIAARDWAGTEAVLGRWRGLADPAGLRERERRVNDARAAVTARIAGREQAVQAALAARDVKAAEAALAALAAEDPNHEALARGRDELARIFLGQAREARAAGRFADARALVAEGGQRASDAALETALTEELASIDADETASQQQLAAAEQAKAAAARQARIDALRGEFTSYVGRMPVTAAGVAEARGLLDRLAGLAPDDPLLSSGLETIAGRFASAAADQGKAGQFEEGLATVAAGQRLLPGSKVLAAEAERLGQAFRTVQADRARAALAAARGQAEQLLGAADFSADWARRTGAALEEVERLADADQAVVDALGGRLDGLYDQRLEALLADNQFVEARALLGQWSGLRPADAAPQREARARLDKAFAAWEQGEAKRRERAEIEANKQTLLTQARADQAEKALATLATLRARMAADDPFLTTEAPEAIAGVYVRMATQSTRRGRHDPALKLLDKAVELVPGLDTTTLRREIARNQGRDAFSAQLAGAGDPAALANLAQPLAAVRELAGEDFPEWSEDWGKSLVARIKAAKPAEGEALLAAARALLPESPTLAGLVLAAPQPMAMPTPPQDSGGAALASARDALAARRLTAAGQALASARAEAPGDPALAALEQALQAETAKADKAMKVYELAVSRGELAKANKALAAARALWVDRPAAAGGAVVAAARPVPAVTASQDPCKPSFAGYGNNRNARCADALGGNVKGPELVVVPAGGGNPRPFAITRYEVSVAEYNAYCAASRECNPLPARSPKLPATGLSVTQAEQYAAWLSKITGATYRLPTAAEWQFAAAARGEAASKDANCLLSSGGQVIKGGKADLVSTGSTNSWGIVNAIGNVQEWTRTGAAVQAHGGHYADDASRCTVNWAVGHSGQGDAFTGFRLVKEIRG